MNINANAPVFQANGIFIQATPERVWAVLTDINQWPTWNSKISKATLEGQAGGGCQISMESQRCEHSFHPAYRRYIPYFWLEWRHFWRLGHP